MNKIHGLLASQLKALGIDLDSVSSDTDRLIQEVNSAYFRFEENQKKLKTSLEEDSEALKMAHAELEVVFSTIPDMYFRLNKENLLVDCKGGFEDQDYPPIHEFLEQSITSFPWPDFKRSLLKAVEQVKTTRKMVSIQFTIKLSSGKNYFEARLLPVLGHQIICVLRNVSEAKQAELELIKNEEQYRSVLESSPDPIIVYDMEGNTEYLNPAFTKVFGWTFDEVFGSTVDFVPPTSQKKTREKIDILKKGEDIEGFETQRLTKSGEIRDVIINASLRMDTTKTAVGSVVTIVDITWLKKLEAELRYTKDQAESANKAKSEFLANMSHELRTPMHAILGFAKIAMEKIGSLDKEKTLEYMEEIYSSGERLMHLLNDLLDISKLEVGRVDYDLKPHSLTEAVDLVIQEFYPLSVEKEIRIDFEKPGEKDEALFDRNKILQVIRNLLSNAIKFSHSKSSISIKVNRKSGILLLSIKDNGIGIPPNELDMVFDKFVQSSKSKSDIGGTGLGLAICSEIITAHEGRIWAKNNSEGGTTFFVSLSAA